ncbi:DNA helicase UvrD [candidate division KSB1 bacterium]|nr:DNA helicase UvrD [bacterium]RKY77727.1 MAG: DNA helicase UvrD [candidate division KSB1 bacterium]RKY85387.1 MAG: DNA helicase UvrD [candidate division KSB1 bacterium]RKY87171.1 MAG: DNA helicase UvrD [candidate division KSB1 bacterium]HDI52252.1 DNA helicase UvrD [Bacteroidota bacterium]
MPKFIADFHVHSKYSRATSEAMEVQSLAQWAKWKGIDVLATADFTHPAYFAELKAKLRPLGNGLFVLKNGDEKVKFILTTEVSNIFTQDGKGRRIHTLIFAPSFEVVERINAKLEGYGKLESDGRPTFGFPVKELPKMILSISEECLLVPAHAWTPWYSIFGANSGFDSIEECFGEQSRHIYAIETGLSSDPEMNWRLSALDNITLISNSDAHSPSRLGREANVFDCTLDYQEIIRVIKQKDRKKFLHTIEFYPQEGKYHYDGHRNCGVLLSPEETRKCKGFCPVCGRTLTIGVMNRVEALADRPAGFVPTNAIPSLHLVPLQEIIAQARGVGVQSAVVLNEYRKLIQRGGSEFSILLDLSRDELATFVPPKILTGILKVRKGDLKIVPGYDGVYGQIKIFDEKSKKPPAQMGLF